MFTRFRLAPGIVMVFILLSQGQVNAQQTEASAALSANTLFRAIRTGSSEAVSTALSGGANVNDSIGGYTPLMAAAVNGTVDQMKLLIDHGALVNYTNVDGYTPLWMAVPDMAKTKLLLEHGANPQSRSKEGYTLIAKLSFLPGTAPIIKLMMQHGVDVKTSAPDNTLMYNAASTGDTAMLGIMIQSGMNVNDTVSLGDYPINAALNFRCFATLKMLVDHGANVNVQPKNVFNLAPYAGSSPLMFAALNNAEESCLYLLEHGANPNLKNVRGYTALMMCQQSETPDPKLTAALIAHGADANVTAPDGTTALSYALQKGNTECVTLIKKQLNK